MNPNASVNSFIDSSRTINTLYTPYENVFTEGIVYENTIETNLSISGVLSVGSLYFLTGNTLPTLDKSILLGFPDSRDSVTIGEGIPGENSDPGYNSVFITTCGAGTTTPEKYSGSTIIIGYKPSNNAITTNTICLSNQRIPVENISPDNLVFYDPDEVNVETTNLLMSDFDNRLAVKINGRTSLLPFKWL